MANIWKKWFTNSGGMRVVLVLLCLFVTFSIPLNHTCQLGNKDLYDCHSVCSSYQETEGNFAEARFVPNQASYEGEDQCHSTYCLACLYSLTSKAFKFCSNASLYSIQAVVRTQILPQLDFTKQFEWLSSVSLRAPPSITS